MRDINEPTYINEVAQIMEANGLSRIKVANQRAEIVLEKYAGGMMGGVMYGANEGAFGYSPHLGGANLASGVNLAVTATESQSSTQPTAETNATVATPSDVSVRHTPETNITEVKSPIVGVFYMAPTPDSAPFTTIGTTVKKGDILCIIEAMKLMNEVTAEKDGKILDICVQNGDVVEFGTVLFKIGE